MKGLEEMNDWENPKLFNVNRLSPRAYYIPFADRAAAVAGHRAHSEFFKLLYGKFLQRHAIHQGHARGDEGKFKDLDLWEPSGRITRQGPDYIGNSIPGSRNAFLFHPEWSTRWTLLRLRLHDSESAAGTITRRNANILDSFSYTHWNLMR